MRLPDSRPASPRIFRRDGSHRREAAAAASHRSLQTHHRPAPAWIPHDPRQASSHDSRRLDGGRQAAGLLWLDVNTARSSASGQRPRTCSRWLARTGGARESRRRWTVVAGVSGGVVAATRSAQVAVVTSRDRRGLKSFPGRRGREAQVQDV